MEEQAPLDEFSTVRQTENNVNSNDSIKLKYLARINPSKSEVADIDSETSVSFVSLDNFGTDGEIHQSETKNLAEVYDGYTYFREGDIALAKITPSFENGKGAICRELTNGIGFGTTELHVLRPRENVDSRFVWYILKSKPFVDEAKAAMRGVAGQQRVPGEFLENYEVPNLSLQEQQKIVRFLDLETHKLNLLISKCDTLINNLNAKRQSEIYRQISGESSEKPASKEIDVQWLSKIPEHWNFGKVGWYFDIELGKMLDEKQISGEYLAPYLRNQDVQWWDINTNDLPKMDFTPSERKKYELKKGDVLVCEGGEIGRSAVWSAEDTECYYQKALHRVRPVKKDQNPRFFCYFMEFAAHNGVFAINSNTSTISHLTVEKLKNQKIPLPPKQEQDSIVSELDDVLNRVERLKNKIKSQITCLEEKQQALITKAVRDQIDLND